MQRTVILSGSDSLLLQVRGDFTRKGTSLSAWCKLNGIDHAHAHRVLRGHTNGAKAQALRDRLIEASRLKEAA